MSKYIEGDWKSFEFCMINPELDIPRVLDFLKETFYYSTPLTAGFDRSKDYEDESDALYKIILSQRMGFYVLYKKTAKIAGIWVTYIQSNKTESKIAALNFQSKQMKIMSHVMGMTSILNKEANIYERYGINSFANFYTGCVDPIYQGQGLATEMYKRALAAVRANENIKVGKSNLTSPWTRKIFKEFSELGRAFYNDFQDENGEPLLKGRTDDEFVAYSCVKF